MEVRKETGVSLLEVLVAIAIVGMLLGALLTMMQQENNMLRDSAEALSARLKANETMERLKVLPFNDIQSSSRLIISELKQMTIQVDVSHFAESTDLKKAVVTVSWFDRRGRERQYSLTTLRFRNPPARVNGTKVMAQAEGGGQ